MNKSGKTPGKRKPKDKAVESVEVDERPRMPKLSDEESEKVREAFHKVVGTPPHADCTAARSPWATVCDTCRACAPLMFRSMQITTGHLTRLSCARCHCYLHTLRIREAHAHPRSYLLSNLAHTRVPSRPVPSGNQPSPAPPAALPRSHRTSPSCCSFSTFWTGAILTLIRRLMR